jgi:hypothetical protein
MANENEEERKKSKEMKRLLGVVTKKKGWERENGREMAKGSCRGASSKKWERSD